MKAPTQRRHELMRRWAESLVLVENEPASAARRERVVAWTAVAVERAAVMAKNRRRRAVVIALLAAGATTLIAVAAVRRRTAGSQEISGTGPRFQDQARVDIGAVHVRVPRSTEGQTFAVRTPRGEVTVHTYPSGLAPENPTVVDGRR